MSFSQYCPKILSLGTFGKSVRSAVKGTPIKCLFFISDSHVLFEQSLLYRRLAQVKACSGAQWVRQFYGQRLSRSRLPDQNDIRWPVQKATLCAITKNSVLAIDEYTAECSETFNRTAHLSHVSSRSGRAMAVQVPNLLSFADSCWFCFKFDNSTSEILVKENPTRNHPQPMTFQGPFNGTFQWPSHDPTDPLQICLAPPLAPLQHWS